MKRIQGKVKGSARFDKSKTRNAAVLATAQKYIKYTNENEVKEPEPEKNESKGKRKATDSDKERKREKNRLKRQRKKEMKQRILSDEAKSVAKEEALAYLRLWSSNKNQWSFKKKRQYWLLKHIFNPDEVSDEDFEILLDYVVGIQGAARDRLSLEAEKVIQSSEGQELKADKSDPENALIGTEVKPAVTEAVYARARNVLQYLV